MQNFPYKPGYVGELDLFTDQVGHDLENLIHQLNPALVCSFSERDLPKNIPGEHCQIVVVEEIDGEPHLVGTANLSVIKHSFSENLNVVEEPTLWLGSLVVDENVRGKGVAGRIWEALLAEGRTRGIHKMQFTSNPSREAAHAFYAKMGAVKLGPVSTPTYILDSTSGETGKTPTFDNVYEAAAGLASLCLQDIDGTSLSSTDAKSVAKHAGTQRVEQILPVSDHSRARSTLFSVKF